ncbi:MAG: magnesium transporter CorA family protein [Bacteroidales bacterium]|nr:magnesium transporter CorA family protein [Bacteroidales bacterium]
MITYLECEKGFSEIEEWHPGCWVKVVEPTQEEMNILENHFGLPEDFLNDISDVDERPRIERNDGWICTIIRIPITCDSDAAIPFITVPLGVMVKDDIIITLCYYKNFLTTDFIDHTQKRNIDIKAAPDFILRLLNSSAYWYLKDLRDVYRMVADAESELEQSIRNEDLLKIMNIQKSLVIFAAAISGNNILMERLNRMYAGELDRELFEDVSIELRQADTTAAIATQMLDRTLNTYASVISNNVNAIMKRLTSISLILMIPTLIASFYGMNVDVGISMENDWAFGAIAGVGLTLSVLTTFWLHKIKWL